LCLRGDPSSPGLRRRCRRLPRGRLRRHFHLGRPRRRGGGLPRRRHDGRGTNLPYGRHGRLLLGDMRFDLTPRSHPNYLGQGVKYPSACLRSSDRDLGVPALNVGGASPPGGWLDDLWPSLGSGLRPSWSAMSSSLSSSSSSSSSSSGVSGDGSNGSPSLACLRRRFSKASRARILSRARAFSASFFSLPFSAASLHVVRLAASSGTGGRESLKPLKPWGRTKIPTVRIKDVGNTTQNRRRIGHLPGTHTHGRDASGVG
jgi:hypothetical protein